MASGKPLQSSAFCPQIPQSGCRSYSSPFTGHFWLIHTWIPTSVAVFFTYHFEIFPEPRKFLLIEETKKKVEPT